MPDGPSTESTPQPKGTAVETTYSQPRVTALVVSYFNVDALRRCIAALEKSNDRAALEIIVIDKGSQDGSATIDSEFPHLTVLRLPRNFGNTKALNIGMRTAAAELVLFMVPEVEVRPETVVQLANRLDDDVDAVAVCPVLHESQFYRLPTPAHGVDLHTMRVDQEAQIAPVEGATFEAMMARKYFVRGINFLDEKYGETWSDVDLCFQIRRSGKKVLALPQVACDYTPPATQLPENALKLMQADRVSGATRYFGKYYGFMAGFMLKLKETFKALFSFKLGLFSAVLGGRKVDGTQHEL